MFLIAALYGLAMLLVPLAHQPLNVSDGPDLSAYALPDGTLPILCASLPGKPGQPAGKPGVICDACLLTSAPGLVVAGLEIPPVPFAVPVRIGQTFKTHGIVRRHTTAARPRAPPRSLA